MTEIKQLQAVRAVQKRKDFRLFTSGGFSAKRKFDILLSGDDFIAATRHILRFV